jgi:hypothetical protein
MDLGQLIDPVKIIPEPDMRVLHECPERGECVSACAPRPHLAFIRSVLPGCPSTEERQGEIHARKATVSFLPGYHSPTHLLNQT